ncbi:MAG: ribosomal protein S18-alanine N-acetyltransferase [Nitrospirales bacterium]
MDPGGSCTLKPDRCRLIIEAAGPSDLDVILQIEQSSFSAPWSRKMMQAELDGNPFAFFTVGRKAEGLDLVGYICYWVVFEELRVMTLAVDQTARRQGIATVLVESMLGAARTRGARRAVLEVRASNEAALNLYNRFGFRQVGVRAGYYRQPVEDAIVMERGLDPTG